MLDREDSPILYETDGSLAWLRLNRPESLNAISPEVVEALAVGLDRAQADPAIRLVAITGQGRGFSSGADIHVMDGATPQGFMAFLDQMNAVWLRVRAYPKPVVAALNGVTVGAGFELALLEDAAALADAVRALADESALGGPRAVALIKRCLNETGSLATSVVIENEAATKCFVSPDQQEGLRAFLEKRSPRWTGP